MPQRQKLEKIERKAKTVHFVKSWSDAAGIMKDPGKAKSVLAAIRAIQGGAPLPSGYYRKGVGVTPDPLLQADGIMHLHLGKANTSDLLYLVQYPDDVVLLELSTHRHFARPIGSRLRATHDVALTAKEAEIAARAPGPRAKIALGPRKVPAGPSETAAPASESSEERKADPSTG